MIFRSQIALVFVLALLAAGGYLLLGPDTNNLWTSYLSVIHSVQQGYHALLLDAVKQAQFAPVTASASLIGLSFLYGIFHAAGPGHGKVVISTYLLSTGDQLRRGVMLSFSSSFLQGITAILLVTAATWVLNYSMRTTQLFIDDVELASFILIAATGGLIIWLRLKNLVLQLTQMTSTEANNSSDDTHRHCGHSHLPASALKDEQFSFSAFVSIVLSTGLRPCSGAVIVLLFANSLDLFTAGLLSVLAMSLGVALTTSGLAALTVYARHLAEQLSFVKEQNHQKARLFSDLLAICGGLIILLFGLSLIFAALSAPSHPFK